MTHELWLITMALVMSVYTIGVLAGKSTERAKWRKFEGTKEKHWDICTECMPGVAFKFGADTKDHLRQVMEWHEIDFHGEDESCSDMSAGPTSQRPLSRLILRITSVGNWVRDVAARKTFRFRFHLMSGFARIAFPICEWLSSVLTSRRWIWQESDMWKNSTST